MLYLLLKAARVGPHQPVDQLQERRFAAPAGADDRRGHVVRKA